MTSQARRRWVLCAVSALAVSCLSPTLPLPPPSEPVVSGPSEAGWLRLRGTAPNGSWMHAFNRTTGNGAFQAVEQGRYDFEIQASVGDALVLWYAVGGDESLPLDLTVEAPQPEPESP